MKNSVGNLVPVLSAVVSLLLPALCPPCAYADDTSAGIMLPGLRSDPPGSITVSAPSLVLRSGNIELTLIVSVGRRGSSLTIQMPRFGWLGESEPYPDRQFPELIIVSDGVPATVESKFAAFVGSADVTEEIRKSGVDPFIISDTPPFVTLKTGGALALEELERLGAIEKSGADYLARWTAQRTVRFALDSGSHTLMLKYKGRPGYALLRFDQITRPFYLARYCLSSADLLSAFGHVAATRMFFVSDYAIPLSIDHKPLSSASVAMDAPGNKHASRSLMACCGAGGKAVIGGTTGGKLSARPDANGIVRVLSIEPPPVRDKIVVK